MNERNGSVKRPRRDLKQNDSEAIVRWTIVIILFFMVTTGMLWTFTVVLCDFFEINGEGFGIFSKQSFNSESDTCELYDGAEADFYVNGAQRGGQFIASVGFCFHAIAVMIFFSILIVTEFKYNAIVQKYQMDKQSSETSKSVTSRTDGMELSSRNGRAEAVCSTKKHPIVKSFTSLWRFMTILLSLSFLLLLTTFTFGSGICFLVNRENEIMVNATAIFSSLPSSSSTGSHKDGIHELDCEPGVAGICAIINVVLLFDLILITLYVDPATLLFPDIKYKDRKILIGQRNNSNKSVGQLSDNTDNLETKKNPNNENTNNNTKRRPMNKNQSVSLLELPNTRARRGNRDSTRFAKLDQSMISIYEGSVEFDWEQSKPDIFSSITVNEASSNDRMLSSLTQLSSEEQQPTDDESQSKIKRSSSRSNSRGGRRNRSSRRSTNSILSIESVYDADGDDDEEEELLMEEGPSPSAKSQAFLQTGREQLENEICEDLLDIVSVYDEDESSSRNIDLENVADTYDDEYNENVDNEEYDDNVDIVPKQSVADVPRLEAPQSKNSKTVDNYYDEYDENDDKDIKVTGDVPNSPIGVAEDEMNEHDGSISDVSDNSSKHSNAYSNKKKKRRKPRKIF